MDEVNHTTESVTDLFSFVELKWKLIDSIQKNLRINITFFFEWTVDREVVAQYMIIQNDIFITRDPGSLYNISIETATNDDNFLNLTSILLGTSDNSVGTLFKCGSGNIRSNIITSSANGKYVRNSSWTSYMLFSLYNCK